MSGKTIRSNTNISVAKVAQSVNLPLKKTNVTPKKLKSLLPVSYTHLTLPTKA